MKKQSIWKDVKTVEYEPLKENISVDVLIVGGGITGLSVLYHFKDSGLSVALVEENICGHGVTSKSTAKITYLQDNTIMNIANFLDEKTAEKYIRSQKYAVEHLADIIEKEKIDCNLERTTSYLFTNTKKGTKKLCELTELLRNTGSQVCDCKEVPFDEPFKKAISVEETYVFHPLKYVIALKKKFAGKVYEHTRVEKIEKTDDHYTIFANGCRVETKYVVLASHYPYFLIPYFFPLKSHIEVSYLGAEPIAEYASYSAINIDKPTVSMRFHRDGQKIYRLYLSNSLPSCQISSIEENFSFLTDKSNFDYVWSNNDIITADYLPYIGPLTKNDSTILLATGYNTWGMTNATLAGKIISDEILGIKNEYREICSPHRHMNLSKMIRFPLDISASALAYIKSTKNNKNNGSVRYDTIDGKRVAIYRDKNGVEHIVLNRCPHMKCGLVLNETELTWDCLCHGSRFDIDGHVIEGPSNCDISFPKEKIDKNNNI